MAECNHQYSIPSGKFRFCLRCRKVIEVMERDTGVLEMPPRIYEIDERLWTLRSPWPFMPYEAVRRYDWYITMIGSDEFLVMPITRGGKNVSFSARRLSGSGNKYHYQAGVRKAYWLSEDTLPNSPIIMCEGVADAAYCSFLGSSIGVLGSYYDGSLDDLLRNRNVALLFDCDGAGLVASMRIATHIQKVAKNCKVVVLPYKKDPTDLELPKLRERIYA